MKLLFSSYGLVFKHQNEGLWATLFKDVIKTILIEIDIQIDSNKRSDVEKLKIITGVVLKNCIECVALYVDDSQKFPLLASLYMEIVSEFMTEQKNSQLSLVLIDSLDILRQKLSQNFTEKEWTQYITIIHILFETTSPNFLYSLVHSDVKEQVSPHQASPSSMTKCISQLQLVI